MKNKITRRNILSTAGGALGAAIAPRFGRSQSNAPIRIGILLPSSGPFALVGAEVNVGIDLFLDSINYRAAGRQIVVIKEDETAEVASGVAKARKLLEQDNAHCLIGGATSSILYATLPLVVRAQVPYVVAVAGGAQITRNEHRSPYMCRTSYNAWAITYPFAKYAALNVAKKVHIFCPDFVAGKEYAEAFKKGFTEAGGTIVGETFAPLSTPDFVPYLTQIADSKPEAIFGFWAGSAAIRYLKAFDQLGLKKNIKQLLTGFAVDNDTLPATGNAAVGALSAHIWNYDLNFDANRELVRRYEAKFSKRPSYLPVWGWDAMRTAVAAIEKVKGDVETQAAFAAAFPGLQFDSPRGSIVVDEHTHDIIEDLYIRETVDGSPLPENKVIATLSRVKDPLSD
jgi:branched-chain amino acid transport system substrate-binding protein